MEYLDIFTEKYWHICWEYETVPTSLFLSFFPSRLLSWGWRIPSYHCAALLLLSTVLCQWDFIFSWTCPHSPKDIHSSVSASSSYLKREHGFHCDFWHDPQCDRNTVIHFPLMQVLTWVRNLAILYTNPSRDTIKSVKASVDLQIHANIHMQWISFSCSFLVQAWLSIHLGPYTVRGGIETVNARYIKSQVHLACLKAYDTSGMWAALDRPVSYSNL